MPDPVTNQPSDFGVWRRLFEQVDLSIFREQYLDRRPLYVGSGRADHALLPWNRFNQLLGQRGAWTSDNLRMVRDAQTLPPSSYCTAQGNGSSAVFVPTPEKVQLNVRSGASVIANEIHTLDPSIAEAAAVLSEIFGADVGANAYFSPQGVRGFGAHYDAHDVFAVQTEGSKTWRLYDGQMDRPITHPQLTNMREWFEARRGALAEEITLNPGDVLYVPRGRFHEAIANGGPSLHVTFSVTGLHAQSILPLLENAVTQLTAFRSYLPSASQDNGVALRRQLRLWGDHLQALVASDAFFDEVAMRQQQFIRYPVDYQLPSMTATDGFIVTGQGFPTGRGAAAVVYEWCGARERFNGDEAQAELDFVSRRILETLLSDAERAGALVRDRVGG